ncbi:anti-sigma B factor antagonist [Aliiroseovarius halocynthiae]|uniref:Anti-sigma factor antagonist n=1 Tax=Aliiroseovarius halocynthiae TaxID=985055 RepID=A0A545SPG4_9RHOB|nr:STAS domain-containing protein [Aliiroseovarius halocynthiae]TQV66868.1 STAS domain-containing protein [Aliiroseovarius halocynthiae]SMR82292.1 anti-sigma B factor antagonist [Aliiroseovarius halocynthiae]
MQLNYQDGPAARVITIDNSRIDAAIAIKFKDQMRDITSDGPQRVVVDMTAVDFIDSSGLGAIVAAMKQVPDGRSFELAGLSKTVSKVFSLTRMDTVFTIHDSVDSALDGGLATAS